MAATFTIKNTSGTHKLEVRITGGGPPQEASLIPGEEQSFTADQQNKILVTQGVPVAPEQHK